MNYAIILDNGNCGYSILGKNIIDYIIDELKKIKIDDILCINNKSLKEKLSIINNDGFSIVLNGDTPLIDMGLINDLIDYHLCNNNDLSICMDEDKNNSVYCVKTKLLNNNLNLNDFEVFFCDKKVGKYIIKDKIKLLRCKSLVDLAKAEEYIRLSIINKHLKNGVRIEGINNVFIAKDVVIENNVVIRNSYISGNSYIYSGSVITNSEINNSTIFGNTNISYSVINDSIIGDRCSIGPFSNIRNNSVILGNNRIGNFVEIKNSRIGKNTKLSHLAYMGDATCGDNVNFGCGSITVNYDGKNKYKTLIGNNVFIGCNTNLIAPIEIKDNSFIAAGSTIVNDLDDGDFAIARSQQVTKKGYAAKYE